MAVLGKALLSAHPKQQQHPGWSLEEDRSHGKQQPIEENTVILL